MSNDITVIDLANHTVVATIPLSNGAYFFGMAITPDGRHLYVSEFNFGSGSVVDVVNTQSGQIETVIPVGLGPVDMTMTQDGSKVYVSNAYSSNISVIETETNTVVATLPCGGITPRCLQLIDNEQKLLVVNANSHNLALIDLDLEQVVSTIPTGRAPNYFTTVCGDGYEGTKVYVSCRGDHLNPASIDVVHLEKGSVTTRLAVNDAPLGSILAPDGTHLYVAVGNNQTAYLDTQTDAITSYITVGSSPRFMTHSASAPVYTDCFVPTHTQEPQLTAHIYPNPVSGVLSIDLPLSPSITQIALLDVYGRLLKTVAGNVRQIEMSDMAAGTYIVRIFEGEKRSATCRVQKLK